MTTTQTIRDTPTTSSTDATASFPAVRASGRRVKGAVLVVAVLLGVAVLLLSRSDTSDQAATQTTAIAGQGGQGDELTADGARLTRRGDGVFAELDLPVPQPGTYEYPTADMLQPWAAPHPPVSPGASDAPEVFTVWLIAFNDGSLCTDGRCDADDIGSDTAARGGAYQLDGRVADGERLHFVGNVRIGQEPLDGAPLTDANRAEIHILIAPHGRVLGGADGWRQLNGPVGNPAFWWAAEFKPV